MLGLSTYTITKFVSVAVYIEPSRTQAKLISPTHTVAWSQVLERYRWYISPPISQVYTRVRSLNINSNEKRKTYLLTNMYQNTIHDLGHKINRSGLLSCQGGARLRATVVPTPVYMFFFVHCNIPAVDQWLCSCGFDCAVFTGWQRKLSFLLIFLGNSYVCWR